MTHAFIITPYAGVLGLLAVVLTANVIIHRGRAKATFGDGGAPALIQALRAHGNFVEQAPITLILIILAEAGGAQPVMVHLMGAGLVISRVLSAFNLTRTLQLNPVRVIAASLGMIVLAAAAISALLTLLRA
jgi:uncharacterized membrane protein YecN with MAPEG domain